MHTATQSCGNIMEDKIMTADPAPDVARWHCHPIHILRNSGDGINRHQHAVKMLAVSLCAWIGLRCDDGRLIDYCKRHDEPERMFGDWPGPICKRPDVAALKAALESEFWASQANPLPKITAFEHQVFNLCDKLEGVLWAKALGVTLQRDIEWCMAKALDIGPAAVAWLEDALE